FCGYNMSDYFGHWLALGERLQAMGATLPRFFTVNWFQTDENGRFLWPGFGENMRVLKWMLERIEGSAEGRDTLFGTVPRYEDMSWSGLDLGKEDFQRVTAVDEDAWKKELASHVELFDKLHRGLPAQLRDHCGRLMAQLG
ncbi:MAG: phosphoenolpyruvate carboxykinase domain-containing protein, partial [Candidimonas sp.]